MKTIVLNGKKYKLVPVTTIVKRKRRVSKKSEAIDMADFFNVFEKVSQLRGGI